MMYIDDQATGEIDVAEEIDIQCSYHKHPQRGYHCAYTHGMDKFGCPELCLMDYYNPDDAAFILINVADCVLNGDFFDPDTHEYDFFTILSLESEDGEQIYSFGFFGATLYGQDVICLQQLDEDNNPVHPGEEWLPSYAKRGLSVWPMFRYADGEDEEDQTS